MTSYVVPTTVYSVPAENGSEGTSRLMALPVLTLSLLGGMRPSLGQKFKSAERALVLMERG